MNSGKRESASRNFGTNAFSPLPESTADDLIEHHMFYHESVAAYHVPEVATSETAGAAEAAASHLSEVDKSAAAAAEAESMWRDTDDYNVREGCNIFVEKRNNVGDIGTKISRALRSNDRITDLVSDVLEVQEERSFVMELCIRLHTSLILGDWIKGAQDLRVRKISSLFLLL
jgi:hypothetical protein